MSFPVSLLFISALSSLFLVCWTYPDPGKWTVVLTESRTSFRMAKSLFKNSQIMIQLTCDNHPEVNISIQWSLTQTQCWEDLYKFMASYEDPVIPSTDNSSLSRAESRIVHQTCAHGAHLQLPSATPPPDMVKSKPGAVYWIPADGLYLFLLKIIPESPGEYNMSVSITMKSQHGYLSAVNWPLLPFYGCMCGVYVVLGAGWLTVCALQWRDLLRVQFWIGAVLLLGMLEKATFYAEYSSINSTGLVSHGAVLAAEWVSVAKRSLARMLVIIVSLGFGIVKPRLGPMLQRVVAMGALWGALAALEAWLRLGGGGDLVPGDTLLAAAPLALLDAALCWWVFSSLVTTTRTLRLRRNTVKLTLYKHFTNTLIFAVISSLVFMLYSIKVHSITDCLSDWKELWMDDANWHVLFSVVLLVIMVLWRPTNNNQRYAFTPLLDNPDDDDDEEEQFVSDAYGVKLRGFSGGGDGAPPSPPTSHRGPSQPSEEADLRWVEDNIPAASLPVLDSDEEILNVKFEVSKMQ